MVSKYVSNDFIVSHQQTMIKKGIMENLIKLISSEHIQVQIKAFEVLLHFDGIYVCFFN
jgi:hypothetical protein